MGRRVEWKETYRYSTDGLRWRRDLHLLGPRASLRPVSTYRFSHRNIPSTLNAMNHRIPHKHKLNLSKRSRETRVKRRVSYFDEHKHQVKLKERKMRNDLKERHGIYLVDRSTKQPVANWHFLAISPDIPLNSSVVVHRNLPRRRDACRWLLQLHSAVVWSMAESDRSTVNFSFTPPSLLPAGQSTHSFVDSIVRRYRPVVDEHRTLQRPATEFNQIETMVNTYDQMFVFSCKRHRRDD